MGTNGSAEDNGDLDSRNIRGRRDVKGSRTSADDARCARTPPWEALRLIVSRARTWDNAGCEREIMINDVSRAYFYAEATRCMYMEIPAEDPLHDPNMLGRLRLCLYGTRDAALNWQQTLSDHLVEAGQAGDWPSICVLPPSQRYLDTCAWRRLLQRRLTIVT